MKVAFSPEALTDPGAHRYLTSIAWMCIDRRHEWVVPDLNTLRVSAWLGAEGPATRRAFTELATVVARRSHPPEMIVGRLQVSSEFTNGCWRAAADIADRALRVPVVVVVENAKCDGAFLRVVALRVGEKILRRRLQDGGFDLLRKRWSDPLGDGELLSVRHGGGSTTATQMELVAEAAPQLARRVLVLVDSDRSTAGAALTGTAGQVEKKYKILTAKYGAKLRIRLRILNKREVENYLPREALRKYGARFDQWEQWTDAERDFNDLKKIINDDLWRVLVNEEYSGMLHEAGLRERAGDKGRELDDLVDDLIHLLF